MLAPSSARVATRGATTPSRAAQAPAVARSGLHAAAAPERCCRRVAASSPQRRQQAVLLRAAAAEFPSATAVTTAAAPAAISSAPALQELNIETFQPFLDTAGDKLVVVDFFTDWCGPCKLILPQLVELSAELAPAATIVKFNCNQANKELAKALGIKVAPTFHLYRNGAKVADMTGAKVDKLRALIDDHLKPQGGGDAQN